MALTPLQLQELQDISIVLAEEFPSNVDDIWNTAMRFQLADIGPLGPGGLPTFEAAVADLKLVQEQLQTVQGRNAGAASGYLEATLVEAPPGGGNLPMGALGDVIYIDPAPNTYLATSVLSLTPAGPNSVILSEVAAAVARTVAPAAGGIEVNNLLTGAGFERVLTTADLGGGVASLTGGININLTGTGTDPVVNLDAAITGVSVDGVTLNAVGPATNYLDESGNYSVPAGAGGGGAAGSITYEFTGTVGGDPGANSFRLNTGNPVSVTAIYFSDTDVDSLDIQNILSTMPVGCHIVMRNTADNTQYRVYAVTAITDNAGWYQFNVDYIRGNGDATIGANGTEIEFEFFTSGWVEPGVALGGNNDEIAFWDPGTRTWVGSGSLISINAASPPLGGRLQLGTTSGYSTTSPQIMRPLGAADTVMDFVYGTDANNGFFQGYRRVAGEMHFGARIASANTDLLRFDLSANVLILAAATFRIGEKAAAAADLATYGQLWVNSADDSLNYVTEAGVNFDLTAGGAVTSVFTRTGAVVAEVGDYSAHYLVKTGGAQTCTSDVTIDGGGGLTIDDPTTNFRLRNSTDLQLFSSGNTEDARFSLTASLMQVTGSGFNPPDLSMQIQNWVGLDINVQTYFQPSLTIGGNSNPGSGASWNVPHGDVPSTPVNGDFWTTTAGAFIRINGVTVDLSASGVANPLTADLDFDGFNLDDGGVIFMREQASADADVTGQGQLWVRTDPFSNSLMWTNDNGNDFEIAALNLSDMNSAAILIASTAFVECLVFSPDINQDYMISAAFEVTSPAADDMRIEMVIDTNAVFKGILHYAGGGGNGEFALDSAVGEVITNIVTIPTDGTASPNGTYVTITGCIRMGATSGTHSVRAAKNADTGADGRFEATAGIQASVMNPIN